MARGIATISPVGQSTAEPFRKHALRAARVFASLLTVTLLGGATVGRAQIVPAIPGIPGIPGMPSVMSPNEQPSTPLQPFTGDLKSLTGNVPTAASLLGTYAMTSRESKTTVENVTVRDFTSTAVLSLFKNGTYELAYRGYWGPAKNSDDPRFNGIATEEQGRFSLSSAVILLEPERTTHTRTRSGVAGLQETLRSQSRPYVARVTTLVKGLKSSTQSLTLVGRCPPYQLDSACQRGMTVQYLFKPTVTTFR